MGRTGRGLSLSSVYSHRPYSFLRAQDYWREYSPGMGPPPNMEELGDGPELSLTFFSPTFLGRARFGMLWAAANPVPSTLSV